MLHALSELIGSSGSMGLCALNERICRSHRFDTMAVRLRSRSERLVLIDSLMGGPYVFPPQEHEWALPVRWHRKSQDR